MEDYIILDNKKIRLKYPPIIELSILPYEISVTLNIHLFSYELEEKKELVDLIEGYKNYQSKDITLHVFDLFTKSKVEYHLFNTIGKSCSLSLFNDDNDVDISFDLTLLPSHYNEIRTPLTYL
jgi:hypothetical protein